MLNRNAVVTIWDEVLEQLRAAMPAEDFRRWFGATAYASDSGDQITVWVLTSTDVRHISVHYLDRIYRELENLDRFDVTVRLVATGHEDEDEETVDE